MRRLMIAAVAALTFASATTALAGDGSGSPLNPHPVKPPAGTRPPGAPTPHHLVPAPAVVCQTAPRANGNAARPQLRDPCH